MLCVGYDFSRSARIPGRSWPEMQPDRGVAKSRILSDGLLDGPASSSKKANGYETIPLYSSASLSPSSLSPSGISCIEHRVTKMDTLAGVAIKYGVEVSDIRRMNGLVTDLQMFAHKSLQIPLPGRHPPSPIMSDSSTQNGERTPPRRSQDDILSSLQSLNPKPPPPRRPSPAMCSLQCFYGLAQTNKRLLPEGHALPESPPSSEPINSRHRKSRSLANVVALESGDITENPYLCTAEILLKKEATGGTFPGSAGKGLSLRPKPGENTLATDPSSSGAFVSVRKSSSTSNLSESGRGISSIWPTGIARPFFDGLPKPSSSRRNKTALD